MRIGFYHLVHSPLEKALPNLLEKAVGAGLRLVVVAGSQEQVTWINNLLWTYADESWLPHGTARDGDPMAHPIWITTELENPNRATGLVICDNITNQSLDNIMNNQEFKTIERVFDLFDGHDESVVEKARERWKHWKECAHGLVYYQQNKQGRWEEKARLNLNEPESS